MASVAKLKAMLAEIPDDYDAYGTNGGNLTVIAEDRSRWAYLILPPNDEQAHIRWFKRKKHA